LGLGTQGQNGSNVFLKKISIAVVELYKLVKVGVIPELPDEFEVLQHGGGDYIVEIDVLHQEHHAILEEATVNDLAVNLLQKCNFKVSILRVFNDDSFENLDSSQF
jgi:hypothetical protein